MILRILKEESIFVRSVRNLWYAYHLFKLRLDETYRDSQTYRTIQGLWDKIKVYFRYSFLGRITEIEEKENTTVLNESTVIRCLINSYKKFKFRLISYFDTSRTRNSLQELTKGLYLFSIKSFSIIIVSAILTNIIFSVLLIKKEIGTLGWIMRGVFLFIGSAGLFCNVTWEDIKKTSYFLKRIT